MIIAIPVNENNAEPSICVSFGRAPWFLFHNTETGETQTLGNPAANAEGGAGIKAAQFVVDQNANVLITVRGGENAAEVPQKFRFIRHKAAWQRRIWPHLRRGSWKSWKAFMPVSIINNEDRRAQRQGWHWENLRVCQSGSGLTKRNLH